MFVKTFQKKFVYFNDGCNRSQRILMVQADSILSYQVWVVKTPSKPRGLCHKKFICVTLSLIGVMDR